MTERRRHRGLPEQQECRAELPHAHRLWFMARAIGTRGVLRRFVSKKPLWYRLIGDDVDLALRRDRQLHPLEIQRLIEVFNAAHALQQAEVLRLGPTPTHAVLFQRTPDRYGTTSWEATHLAVADVQDDLQSWGSA